jgi:hypothetical protein
MTLIREGIMIFGVLLFIWCIVSTIICIGFVVIGVTICAFDETALICSDTLGDAIHYFYYQMWIDIIRMPFDFEYNLVKAGAP